jgi:four helix bundle protein
MTQGGDKFNYDLEERLAKFVESVIELMKKLPNNAINTRMISQVVASSGSSSANYCEACEAESRKDFKHKISIVNKELRETKNWLRFLAKANPDYITDFRKVYQEAHELKLIFSKIKSSCNKKKK